GFAALKVCPEEKVSFGRVADITPPNALTTRVVGRDGRAFGGKQIVHPVRGDSECVARGRAQLAVHLIREGRLRDRSVRKQRESKANRDTGATEPQQRGGG